MSVLKRIDRFLLVNISAFSLIHSFIHSFIHSIFIYLLVYLFIYFSLTPMFDRRAIIPAGRVCLKRECLSQNRHFPQSFAMSFHIAQIVEDRDQTLNKDLQQKCSWVSCPGRLATDKRHTFTTFDTLIGSILLKLDAFNSMHCIFTLFSSASTMSRFYVC